MSLTDWLEARRLPEGEVALPTDPAAWAAAERQVEIDTRTLQAAQARDVQDLTLYRERVASAQAALDAVATRTIRLRCLPPAEWEQLVADCPPTAEQRKDGWQWDVEDFRPLVLARCVIAPDGEQAPTELDWRQVAARGRLAVGELDLLFVTAVQLNTRAPQVATGKG